MLLLDWACSRIISGRPTLGELRTPNAAAQTRTVSARRFWLSQRELPRHLKRIVRPRIPEFESYMPSHAVGLRHYTRRGLGNSREQWPFCESSTSALLTNRPIAAPLSFSI